MSNEITRTLSVTLCHVTKATLNDDFSVTTEDVDISLDGSVTLEKAVEYFSKAAKTSKVKVNSVEHIDKIWAISLEDFIKYGHETTRPASQMPNKQ